VVGPTRKNLRSEHQMKSDGSLRSLFRQHLPQVHWATIETGATEPGVPDLNGCFRRREFWIENKLTKAWSVSFRPEQIGWISRRTRCGGRVFIAVRRRHDASSRLDAVDELYIYSGVDILPLAECGLKRVDPLALYREGPKRWCWDRVLGVIIGNYT